VRPCDQPKGFGLPSHRHVWLGRSQAVAEAQRREEAAAAARNPFSGFGRRQGGFAAEPGRGARRGAPASKQQDGPVIDAEWTTIDDDT
jgi:hypothetical protein